LSVQLSFVFKVFDNALIKTIGVTKITTFIKSLVTDRKTKSIPDIAEGNLTQQFGKQGKILFSPVAHPPQFPPELPRMVNPGYLLLLHGSVEFPKFSPVMEDEKLSYVSSYGLLTKLRNYLHFCGFIVLT
jgi:hypothetical protein